MRTLARVGLLVTGLALGSVRAFGQIPEKFTNLKVLPKGMARADLIRTMRGWTGALGVRCGHCHTGGNPETLEGVDFASDAKWEKRAARAMARMMRALNDEQLARLEPRPAGEGRSVEAVRVECATCHRGLTRPESMESVLSKALQQEGSEGAVRAYRELRSRYLERGSYDFSQGPLNALGERLLADNRGREALPLLELNAESHGESPWVLYLLGEARLQAGDRAGAREAFERCLRSSPDNERAKKRLEELKGEPGRP